MKVKELIKELEGYDEDMEVMIETELLEEVPVEHIRQNIYGEIVIS